jgi:hypothetical protein
MVDQFPMLAIQFGDSNEVAELFFGIGSAHMGKVLPSIRTRPAKAVPRRLGMFVNNHTAKSSTACMLVP